MQVSQAKKRKDLERQQRTNARLKGRSSKILDSSEVG
jgi:hypothetical protein